MILSLPVSDAPFDHGGFEICKWVYFSFIFSVSLRKTRLKRNLKTCSYRYDIVSRESATGSENAINNALSYFPSHFL